MRARRRLWAEYNWLFIVAILAGLVVGALL